MCAPSSRGGVNVQRAGNAKCQLKMALRPKEDAARPTGWTELEALDKNHCTWDVENTDRSVVCGQTTWHVVGSEQWSYTLPSPNSNHGDTSL
jgi:hypothetical protein